MKTSAISCKDVKILDGFWKERQKINRNVTLDAVYNRFDDMVHLETCRRRWKKAASFLGFGYSKVDRGCFLCPYA